MSGPSPLVVVWGTFAYWVSDACNMSNSMKNKYCHFRCNNNCKMTRHWSKLASTQLALSHKKNNPVGFFRSGHIAATGRSCDLILGAAMRRSCDPPIADLGSSHGEVLRPSHSLTFSPLAPERLQLEFLSARKQMFVIR